MAQSAAPRWATVYDNSELPPHNVPTTQPTSDAQSAQSFSYPASHWKILMYDLSSVWRVRTIWDVRDPLGHAGVFRSVNIVFVANTSTLQFKGYLRSAKRTIQWHIANWMPVSVQKWHCHCFLSDHPSYNGHEYNLLAVVMPTRS